MEFVNLEHYFVYIMSNPFGAIVPVPKSISQYGPMLGMVLDRQGNFQLELFIIPEEIQLIEYHKHPNVDALQMHICGDFIFEVNGVQSHEMEESKSLLEKYVARVPAGDIHGLLVNGASAFMTFQEWKNGVQPGSVGGDFIVDHDNPNHFKGLRGLQRSDKPVIVEEKKDEQ